jgi:hypothetical protein
VGIRPFHQRMAELWTIQTRRQLDESETEEMRYCMIANAAYCWKMCHLENLSLLASLTDNTEWQHEICQDIERLEATGSTAK